MFGEFFLEGGVARRTGAWGGLIIFLSHQCFRAWLKSAINEWYGEWYDLMQTSVSDLGSGEGEVASGESMSPTREEARKRVGTLLVQFVAIILPAVFLNPLAVYLKNHWVFKWRTVLMNSYIERWAQVEGASQRVHEDTLRMAAGIHSTVATFVESVLTIVVFAPVLQRLDPTLMNVAVGCAVGGLSVSVIVGWKLVGLEVANQRVEAALRKRLVLLEADPTACATACVGINEGSVTMVGFLGLFEDLRLNYGALYRNFAAFGTWLSFYEQALVVLPYALIGPRLFADDPLQVLTLGQMIKATNAFGRIFDALNILSDRWVEVNEFFSVVKRLREYERAARHADPPVACLVAHESPSSECTAHCHAGTELSTASAVDQGKTSTRAEPV